MPDIRTTSLLSDFGPNTNFEDPISEGGRWERMINASPPNVIKGGVMTNQDTDTLGYSYWTPESFDATPETPVEVWGKATGGGGGSAGWGWRIGVAQTPGPGGGFRGYIALDFHALDDFTLLRKYSSEASFTNIASGGPIDANYYLFRYDGSLIELYSAPSFDPNTWSLVLSATDSEYATDLFLAWGEEDQGFGQICAWDEVGGGVEDDVPQIYRRPFG